MKDIIFANSGAFYLLLLIIPIVAWYIWKQKGNYATIQVSSIEGLKKAGLPFKNILRHVIFGLRVLILVMLIIILARPQSTNNWENRTTEGIDIVLAFDVSSSMLAQDFQPNRMEASKEVAIKFISGRPNDRIGLVVFSGETYTQCPLTTDHAVLINLFKELKNGIIEDGTAIGLGLANAVNRLKESNAISKVIILLTDGVNNRGELDPATAADLAKTFGIRVYTIGVGTNGYAPYPVQTPFGTQLQDMKVEIDDAILTQIAEKTDGKYFRATGNQSLKKVYDEINKLEKSKIEVKQYSNKHEEYFWFAVIAGILLLLEILLRTTVVKFVP
jgi:Ca-activated chloride channel homolog